MSLTSYSPVRRFTQDPKVFFSRGLHVLGVPPAFVLSQDQTLQLEVAWPQKSQAPTDFNPLEFSSWEDTRRHQASRFCETLP